VAQRVPAFGTTYFTQTEQARAQQDADPSRMLTAMWAVKEATGKALGLGTRLDYLSIEALPNEGPEAGTALTWRLGATPQSAPMLADRSLGSAHVVVTFEGTLVQAEVVLAATDSASHQHDLPHATSYPATMTSATEKTVS
jgi:phosphopantetheinyl transferase (holo-ACP synthase)